jgi:predicted DNA-binding protein (MmcQ/YjbR family)
MKLDEVIEHCRRLKHTAGEVKWGSVLAFSIGGKMYCCLSLDEKFGVSFKCSPGVDRFAGKNKTDHHVKLDNSHASRNQLR